MTNSALEQRISERTDLKIAGGTEVSREIGGLAFRDMAQVMEFSKLMSVSGQAVPKHLRGQAGACLAVSLQALNWRMDPFAVANKSYSVNDRIAYEAQLIHAVVEQRAPIKGRIKGEYSGEGAKRRLTLWATSAEDGSRIEYTSPSIGEITTKNSPLWKSDPDQQLWYYSARAMCRRHFPDVILGVYERDEVAASEPMRDVTPAEDRSAAILSTLPEADDAPQDEGDMIDATPEDGDGLDDLRDDVASIARNLAACIDCAMVDDVLELYAPQFAEIRDRLPDEAAKLDTLIAERKEALA